MLFDAIENGDVGTVWQLVQQGLQFEQIDESTELTPLGLAAEAGHAEIVRILLGAGANPDLGGATTPLEAAVVGGHHEVVEALLLHHADVNKAVEEGFTPLMTAATTGDLELIQLLLDAGARIQTKNEDGDTAITLAEDAGHLGVAAVLRARRSRRAQTPDNSTGSVLPQGTPKEPPTTTNSKLAAIVRETEQGSFIAPQEAPRRAAETKAARPPQPTTPPPVPHEDVQREAVVDPQPPSDTPTALPRDASKRLSEVGDSTTGEPPAASPPAHTEEATAEGTIGASAIQKALDHLRTLCAQGVGQAARALRDGLANPRLTDHQGCTLLMAAAYAGEVEIVRLLLAAGADAAQTDATDDGLSALIWAIKSPSDRRIEVLRTLVEGGADPNQRCGLNQRTPLMFAAQADVYLDRPEGPSFGNTTRILKDLGADLEAQDRRGFTVWRLIKRDALGAPTFGDSRRRLHHMVRVLEHCGARAIESHAV